ncbi:hypothetical protein B0H65DRAFT_504725 [Neurospora tetraspora]|uniref:Uncharacterized protein n=1 Tax=Neurospora tetraspora TaxID=94610 RepID=A0AAE0MX43_9PEZI|nr:hypothetical protein B0H65DRAFT_504725 [Neurospora tetraspora]
MANDSRPTQHGFVPPDSYPHYPAITHPKAPHTYSSMAASLMHIKRVCIITYPLFHPHMALEPVPQYVPLVILILGHSLGAKEACSYELLVLQY